MDDLLAARWQMALSLGFHIIFASIGMAMPFFMATSHALYLRKKNHDDYLLTKAWSKGVAIFFAVGAVSGTLLSFELGLLWPGFMKHAGPIIGMPFSWEGAAFFLEAIALGIFLYGWDRIRPWLHWTSGLVVGFSGLASAAFVICANGWMNTPAGFDWNGGNPINIDPYAAMFNDAAFLQGLHMIVAAFQAVGFSVAGLHAYLWMRTKQPIHFRGMKIAFVFGAIASIVQPVVGDFIAKNVAQTQPAKLAAMESHFETTSRAPLIIGGIPDVENRITRYAIELPGFLSFLAFGDFDAKVTGLNDIPRDQWPPVTITHFAFQIMVGIGTLLLVISIAGLGSLWRGGRLFSKTLFLKLLIVTIPLGFIAIEAGWVVTEVGRQPWIIYGLMRTEEALTPRPGIVYTFVLYTAMYTVLSIIVAILLRRQVQLLHATLDSRSKGGVS